MSEAGASGPRVIVCEDEADIRTLVVAALRLASVRADAFADADTALAAAAEDPPRAYVVDVIMPGMSGLQLCRALKSSEHTARPVMLVSANSEPHDVAAGYAAGCDDFLPKPFSPHELSRRVLHLLGD